MNVLILGSGGREHALAWKIARSRLLTRLFIAPGNAGTLHAGTNVNIQVNDFAAIGEFAVKENISLVVVGPEDPLVNGIQDYFLNHPALQGILVIGPGKAGAMLEGSKDFAKEFMVRHTIPTARYKSFTLRTLTEGYAFLESLNPPYVLKADGLAAGKGVLILDSIHEARTELQHMLEGKFGTASKTVVIEEYLSGIELSVFVLTDGQSYKLLPEAKDYKRVGEGDTGLNTGGMGAVSPVPFADAAFMQKVDERIIQRTIAGLQKEAIPYKGFIFFGLMNVKGEPYVIEYNVRMGDPESEVVFPRIESDLLELLDAAAKGILSKSSLVISKQTATTVMLVSGGYPGEYAKEYEIVGLENTEGSTVFHAGTKIAANGKVVTSGGRVLAVTSLGKTMSEALEKSYKNAAKIVFTDKYYRKDIGFDLTT